jgi:tetratricopeptide (TPR) repeat protein
MGGAQRILGVFSMTQAAQIGVGGTAREYRQKSYWFARRLDDDAYEVQPLNANHLPSGMRNVLSRKEFVAGYTPEPGYYEKMTLPHMQSLKKKLEMGERFLDEGNLDEAEKYFCKAILLDENNCRANLGLGQVACLKRDHRRLEGILRRILNLDEVFREEQRHLFNSFGIDLRKAGYHAGAVTYYQRALELNPDDDHLRFNMARACFDGGDLEQCVVHLRKALEINPDFSQARDFLRHLESAAVPEALSACPAGTTAAKNRERGAGGAT